MLTSRLISPVARNFIGRRNMSAIGGPSQVHVPKGVSSMKISISRPGPVPDGQEYKCTSLCLVRPT